MEAADLLGLPAPEEEGVIPVEEEYVPPFAVLPLRFAQLGQVIPIAGIHLAIIIITIQRNLPRAMETCQVMANTLQIAAAAFTVVLSIDGQEQGLSGKEALYLFYQELLLLQIRLALPNATHFMFAEDDVRVDGGLWSGGPSSNFQRLLHKVNRFTRPIVVLGFRRRAITIEFGHRKPDFGLHLWVLKAEFAQQLSALLTEHVPTHVDTVMYRALGHLVGYTSYSVAGYTRHTSDCADANDPEILQGERPEQLISLHRDDYKELSMIAYVP